MRMKKEIKRWIALRKCCGEPDTDLLYKTRKIARSVNKGGIVVPCIITYSLPDLIEKAS